MAKTPSPLKDLSSSSRCRILHPAVKIATILPGIVLHVARRVGDPTPRIVDPVAPHRVAAAEVAVQPRCTRHDHHTKPAERQESGDRDEDDGGGREPYRASEQDDWAEEDKARYRAGERQPGEEEKDAAGDDERQEADDLGGGGGAILEPAEEGLAGGGPMGSWARAGLTVRHSCWWW